MDQVGTRARAVGWRRLSAPVVVVAALVAASAPRPAGAQDPGRDAAYRAQVVRTEQGIPHVTADSYADLGFGYGYVHAEDNLCTLADIYITVAGERSRWFGPDGSWTFHGNGATANNLDSDFFYRRIIASGRIDELRSQAPPHGPLPEVQEAVRGYVAGYNAYLDDVGGAAGVSDPRCAGQEWVRPITEDDAYRRFYQLASLASTGVAIDGIGGAQPLLSAGGVDALTGGIAGLLGVDGLPVPEVQAAELAEVMQPGWLGVGSNAYGLGSEVTDNGRGMVLGNPHFPWQGGERLYQWHATIPGQLDVAGASLLGVPVVLIGHTDSVAWSHTVSTAYRFTPIQLTLAGSPTTYLVDGQPREMEATDVTVEVLQPDGTLTEQQRTLYATEYGPMMTGILGLPLFPWTPALAWSMQDANDQLRYLNHFFAINHARSVPEVAEILRTYQGVPWVNTVAADRDGLAYYADIGAIPNVPDDLVASCNTTVGILTDTLLGLPILDGSRSSCHWRTDDDAIAPGIFGPGNLPELTRSDYVTNSNDSYWLTNPDAPLEGYASIIGDEGTERSLRTRLGLRIVEDRLEGADEYAPAAGDRWTQDLLQAAVFNNRQHAAELTRDAAVEMCRGFDGSAPTSSGVPVATTQDGVDACQVLAEWDLRDDLDSVGALLFRRFWTHASGALPSPWVNGFDPADPVTTPNTLDTSNPTVQQAFGDAITDLDGAGIPLDAPLGDHQSEDRDAHYDGVDVVGPIPIHGGPGGLGVFNAINVDWDPAAGYPDVDHGSSFVMAIQFVDGACPVDADAIVTYGLSEDPTSRWFVDQTRMYSAKEWNDMPFCASEIAAGAVETRVLSTAGTDPGQDGLAPPPVAPEGGATLPATGGSAVVGSGAFALLLGALLRRRR